MIVRPNKEEIFEIIDALAETQDLYGEALEMFLDLSPLPPPEVRFPLGTVGIALGQAAAVLLTYVGVTVEEYDAWALEHGRRCFSLRGGIGEAT